MSGASLCGKCQKVHPWCSGHKKRTDPPEPCMARPAAGTAACRMHGGANQVSKKKAAENLAEAAAAAAVRQAVTEMGSASPLLGALVDVPNPKLMLRELIGWSAGHVAFYRAQVQALGGAHLLVQGTRGVRRTERQGTERGERSEFTETQTEVGPECHLWLRKYDEERDRLAGLCVKWTQLGLDEQVVELAKRDGARVAEAFAWVQRAAMHVWDLDASEVETFRGFLLTALSCLAGGDPFPDPTVVVGQVVPAVEA